MRHRLIFNTLALLSASICLLIVIIWLTSYFIAGWSLLYSHPKRCVYFGSGNGTFVVKQNAITQAFGGSDQGIMITPPVYSLHHNISSDSLPGPHMFIIQAGARGQMGVVALVPPRFPSTWLLHADATSYPRMTLRQADGQPLSVVGRLDQIRIAYWLLVIPFTILPLLWYRRRRLIRRALAGFCRVCGYDLRATPARCPECGSVPIQ